MHRVRFKICGVKTREIADCAVENGADALGFVFYEKSPRNISIQDAASITCALPAFIGKVGVFVGSDIAFIRKAADSSGINAIQVHGDESVLDKRFIKELQGNTCMPVIIAVRSEKLSAAGLSNIMDTDLAMKDRAANYLIDRFDTGEFGGTGKTVEMTENFEADNNPVLAEFIRKKIILAGGINASNLAGILKMIMPYGIDVSSGVEKEKGLKDKDLVAGFLKKAAEWNAAMVKGE
jgi:phosphoribosylanthranilate isomerase